MRDVVPQQSMRLSQIAELCTGGTPSRENPAYWNGSIPWVTPSDITAGRAVDIQAVEKITPAGLSNSGARLVPPKSLLVTTRATLGVTALTDTTVATNQGVTAVIFDQRKCNPRFFYYAFDCLAAELRMHSRGTTFAEISAKQLGTIELPVPSLEEQRRIVEVLGAVDERIDTVRRIIKKRYEVRAGLLRDVLRTLPMVTPPNGWLRLPLSDVVSSVDYGISHALTEELTGIPVLRMNNVGDGKAGFGELKYYPQTVSRNLLLRYGDVLFNRTNSVEHVGRSGMWRNELPKATFASYLVRLNANPTRLIPDYLALWLSHPLTRQRVRAISTPAVQQVNVNPTKLRALPIDLPSSLDEQRRITGLLDIADTQIVREQAELDKLQLLKSGLMEDLLTGRVRVARDGGLTG
jgi:type I restriction enzyme S subunit